MKFCKFLTFIAMLFLTGCGTLEFGIERNHPGTATVNSPLAETPILTTSAVLSSPTAAILPPTVTIPAPTAIQAAPTSTSGPQMVKIYLIGIGDNGQSGPLIGCGDSAIPVDVEIQSTKEVLKASLEKLLSVKEQFYGQSGLYNSLYQSDLQVESITLDNGKAVINLTGSLTLGGECDNPRVEAQLMSTVLQFSTIQDASIFINGILLKDVLSLKGMETTPVPTEVQAGPTATLGSQMVKIYLIAVGDNGQSGPLIGCGDSAVPVDVEIQPTKEVLKASLEKLLSLKDQIYGQSGLYNALYQSDLQVESITLDNGKAVINLTGTLTLGGECDNPRVEAELESTALQFSTVTEVSIFVNGKPLKDVLSLKG